MANASTSSWANFDLSDMAAPSSGKSAEPNATSTPGATEAAAPADWASFAMDDMLPEGAKDYGNGAVGFASEGSSVSGPAEVYTAGKRDRGEDMGGYEDLNKGLGGNYSPVTHGMTFGGSDEILSGMMAPFGAGLSALTGEGPTSLGEAYDQQRAQFLRDKALYEEQYPKTAIAGEIVGGVVTGGAGVKAALNAPSLLRGVARGAGIGAGQAGAYGFLDTDGSLSDRLSAGLDDAKIGAAIGVAGPVLERALPYVGRGISAARDAVDFSAGHAGRVAERDFVKAATADRLAAARAGITDPRHQKFMDEAQLARADDLYQSPTAADMGGETLRQTIRRGVEGDTEAAGMFENVARQRQADASERISDTVSEMLRPGSTRNGANAVDDLNLMRSVGSLTNEGLYRRAFDAAGAEDIFNGRLRRLTGSEAVQTAMAKAAREHAEDRVSRGLANDAPVFKVGDDGLMDVDRAVGGKPSLEYWDRVGKLLRADAEAARDQFGKATHTTSRINSFRDQILNELDNATRVSGGDSLYKAARNNAREFFGHEDAYTAGLKSFGQTDVMDSAVTKNAFAKMSDHDRALFGHGYTQSLVEKLANTPDAADVEKLLNNAGTRKRLRMALGDDRADEVEMFLKREGMIRQTNMLAQQAAKTARNSDMMRQISGLGGDMAGVIGGAAFGGGNLFSPEALLGFVAARGGRKILARMSEAKRQNYARAMAEIATSRDGDRVAALFRQINADPDLSYVTGKIAAQGFAGTAGQGVKGGLAALPKAVEARYLRTTGPLLQLGEPDGVRWAEGDREAKLAAGGSVSKGDRLAALDGDPEFLAFVAAEKTGEKTRELVTRRAEANGTTPEFEFARLQELGGKKTSPTRAADMLRDAAEQVGQMEPFGYAEGGSVYGIDHLTGGGGMQINDVDVGALRLVAQNSPALAALLDRVDSLGGVELVTSGEAPASIGSGGAVAVTGSGVRRQGAGPDLDKMTLAAYQPKVQGYRHGGPVSAEPQSTHRGGGEPRSTHTGNGGEPVVGASEGQGEASSYDPTGGTTPKAMGKTAKFSPSSNRRASSTTAPSRQRSHPERVGRSQPPRPDALKRAFWDSLRSGMTSFYGERGYDIDPSIFPVWETTADPTAMAMAADPSFHPSPSAMDGPPEALEPVSEPGVEIEVTEIAEAAKEARRSGKKHRGRQVIAGLADKPRNKL